ncbi:MAG: LGFP repeat-containing protein [Pseudonocardiaceae bacterium]
MSSVPSQLTSLTDQQALLASPGLEAQAVKGVYFFPGEAAGNVQLYTTHPLFEDDKHWNSDPSTRARVMDRLVAAHVNTVVMSYWSNMPQWSPLALDSTSLHGVLDAVQGRPLVIMPAIEGGFDPQNPNIPHWQFSDDFPSPTLGGPPAPGLIQRIGQLVELFDGRMNLWARLYDRNGNWRYAVHLLHVCSDVRGTTDQSFAQGFADVAAQVEHRYQIPVGFTLDIIGGPYTYVATPVQAGSFLKREPSVLAVHGFQSEVFSGKVKPGPPCSDPDWRRCQPYDNNRDNLENLADWKKAAVRDWAVTGLPVILDVSNGMDGRIVWAKLGVGFWGDNMDYTDDRWRNWMSQLKGPTIRGIAFDTWNGYTEGYAAVPSLEHSYTVYSWLKDLLEPDPRDFSHMQYVNSVSTYRVYGAICEKWLQLGADRQFGVPSTNELQIARGRVSFFTNSEARSAIYWSTATGAHEVHGLIAKTYWEKASGDGGRLGLPISDEQPSDTGRVSFFEHGRIDWTPGDTLGHITYY